MSFIDLDRQFIPWSARDPAALSAYVAWRNSSYAKSWTQLLESLRCVILAEAGSGKTEELKARAQSLATDGKLAFYATVQDTAREGLDSATGRSAEIAAWRAGDQPAWFFIDSVDEAKLDGIRLETALRKISEGIEGARSRAHIIMSGRYSDWEFRTDLERFEQYLPVPSAEAPLPAPTSEAILVGALEGTDRKKTIAEAPKPVVVLMAPLDEDRIKKFARGKDIKNVDAFVRAIEEGNLWSFARRPMDLDWLTAYWVKQGRFGHLATMMEESLAERLREPNIGRRKKDAISVDTSMHAAERIGAAMVFGRSDKLLIPDSQVRNPANASELDIAHVLPDWSEEHRDRLLTRAIFDPATFGRVRLHNDNEGAVRSFLAAKWLAGRQKTNCTSRRLHDMLFADSYGIALIKPSLRETAAWLAIWDRGVAREVIAREPEILLTAGDPASLALDIRRDALNALVGRLVAGGERLSLLEIDGLRRFSSPDLIPEIRKIWRANRGNQEVRELVLRMIWLGCLTKCADIAKAEGFDAAKDRHTLVFAGRAIMATGDAMLRKEYAAFVRKQVKRLPGIVIWEALDKFFPNEIDVEGLLDILANMSLHARDETLGLEYQGPRLIPRPKLRTDLDRLTSGLLDQLGDRPVGHLGEETPGEKAYFPAIDAAAHALMLTVGPDEVPQAAIRAALRIGEERYHYSSRSETPLVCDDLRKTSKRRETALWAAVERFRGSPTLQGRPLQSQWQLHILGWSPELQLEDTDWLLTAAETRPVSDDRTLALHACLDLWQKAGRPDALFARMQAIAANDDNLQAMLEAWLTPRVPSPEELKLNRQIEENKSKRAKEEAKRNQSWIDFVAKLRADPDQLRKLPLPANKTVDGRLFYLWELLHRLDDHRSRYAIDDVSPLAAIVGTEVANAERDALIALWRQWTPTLESQRPPEARNVISKIDCMGIAGITLEAAVTPGWPSKLNSADAVLAAQYGTLELNGFPNWMLSLAERFPDEVRSVLHGEIKSELDDVGNAARFGTLHDLSYGPPELARNVSDLLLSELGGRAQVPAQTLSLIMRTLVKGIGENAQEFYAFFIERFSSASNPDQEATYFTAAFRVNPSKATEALTARLDDLDAAGQTRLALKILPQLFGERISEKVENTGLPFDVLLRLVLLAYQTIRVEEDNRRPNGEVYSPDDRDSAERARSMLFNQLAETPGRATFKALMDLRKKNNFPIPPDRLAEIARNRAALDAEHSPWSPGEAYELEKECDTAPVTPQDLQRLALRRISEIQHDLHHAEFAQGLTVKSLPSELEVQKWVANEIYGRRGRAYSIERESHVADENEPDVRLRAKASDASLPIEIKVAESWSLKALENALDTQLGKRYLRDKDAKHGILLLVHQRPRSKGWLDGKRNTLSFGQLVERLKSRADRTAAKSPTAPQAQIAVIDVSGLKAKHKGRKIASNAKHKQKKRK